MEGVDSCSVCYTEKEICRATKLTYSSSSLQTSLSNHLGPGVYNLVCKECFGLLDLIEYLQVQLKLKISELKMIFSNAIKREKSELSGLTANSGKRRALKEKCPTCLKLVASRSMPGHKLKCETRHADLDESGKPIRKLYTCDICPKSFVKLNDMQNHQRSHTGERPFQCDNCGATFSQKQNLSTHIRTKHMQEKRYACDHCDKKFTRQRLLDCHINSKHKRIKPYKCEHCQARFSYPNKAKIHALNSCKVNVVREKCQNCGVLFKQDQLLNHVCKPTKTSGVSLRAGEDIVLPREDAQPQHEPLASLENQTTAVLCVPLNEYGGNTAAGFSQNILVCQETGTRIVFEDGEDDGDDGVEDGGLQGTNLEIITLQQSDIQVASLEGSGLVLRPTEDLRASSVRQIVMQDDSIALVEEEVTSSSQPELNAAHNSETLTAQDRASLQNEFEVENAVFSIVPDS